MTSHPVPEPEAHPFVPYVVLHKDDVRRKFDAGEPDVVGLKPEFGIRWDVKGQQRVLRKWVRIAC